MINRAAAALFAGLIGLAAVASDSPAQRPAYLVWAADQNGNLLYVLDPEGALVRLMDSVTLGGALE